MTSCVWAHVRNKFLHCTWIALLAHSDVGGSRVYVCSGVTCYYQSKVLSKLRHLCNNKFWWVVCELASLIGSYTMPGQPSQPTLTVESGVCVFWCNLPFFPLNLKSKERAKPQPEIKYTCCCCSSTSSTNASYYRLWEIVAQPHELVRSQQHSKRISNNWNNNDQAHSFSKKCYHYKHQWNFSNEYLYII